MSIDFTVDRTNIRPGECVTFHWRVEGVRAVYFYREGERWQDQGVVGEERRQECPSHTTTYCLRVVKGDNSVEIRQIPIQVQPAGPVPVIEFTVNRTKIKGGKCVTFHWRVEGVRAVYFYREGERWQDHGVVGQERREECPPHTTTYYLRVVKRDNSVEIRQIPIRVVERPAPPPPPSPPPDKPVIHSFSVSPAQIQMGECVTINWKCGGATSWVTIVRGEHIVWDNAPLSGSVQDCPDTPGEVGYRMVAFNPEDERVRQDRTINVIP